MGQHSRERTEDFHKRRLDIFCKLQVKTLIEQQNFERLVRTGFIIREEDGDHTKNTNGS